MGAASNVYGWHGVEKSGSDSIPDFQFLGNLQLDCLWIIIALSRRNSVFNPLESPSPSEANVFKKSTMNNAVYSMETMK